MTSFLRLGKQPAQRLGLAARNLARRAVDCACFKSDIKINDDVNCCQAETHYTVARYDGHKSQGKKEPVPSLFFLKYIYIYFSQCLTHVLNPSGTLQ